MVSVIHKAMNGQYLHHFFSFPQLHPAVMTFIVVPAPSSLLQAQERDELRRVAEALREEVAQIKAESAAEREQREVIENRVSELHREQHLAQEALSRMSTELALAQAEAKLRLATPDMDEADYDMEGGSLHGAKVEAALRQRLRLVSEAHAAQVVALRTQVGRALLLKIVSVVAQFPKSPCSDLVLLSLK